MKLPFPPERRSADIDLLPMINLVFLLLVFVILAGGAVRTVGSDAAMPDRATVRIEIDQAGQLRIDGEPVALDVLATRLVAGAPLQIDADPRLPATRLLGLLEQLAAVGVGDAELGLR
jgi:biopolymer transport protein ExbD